MARKPQPKIYQGINVARAAALPDNLSGLLRLALDDMERTEIQNALAQSQGRRPYYEWALSSHWMYSHTLADPKGGSRRRVCELCLAGSVLAQTVDPASPKKLDVVGWSYESDASTPQPIVRMAWKMRAIDLLRVLCLRDALHLLRDGPAAPNNSIAPDTVRKLDTMARAIDKRWVQIFTHYPATDTGVSMPDHVFAKMFQLDGQRFTGRIAVRDGQRGSVAHLLSEHANQPGVRQAFKMVMRDLARTLEAEGF